MDINQSIQRLLDSKGELKSIPIDMVGVMRLAEYLDKVYGYKMDELNGDETNGWQVDFWYYFTRQKDEIPWPEKLCFSGSLMYGDYTLSVRE